MSVVACHRGGEGEDGDGEDAVLLVFFTVELTFHQFAWILNNIFAETISDSNQLLLSSSSASIIIQSYLTEDPPPPLPCNEPIDFPRTTEEGEEEEITGKY